MYALKPALVKTQPGCVTSIFPFRRAPEPCYRALTKEAHPQALDSPDISHSVLSEADSLHWPLEWDGMHRYLGIGWLMIVSVLCATGLCYPAWGGDRVTVKGRQLEGSIARLSAGGVDFQPADIYNNAPAPNTDRNSLTTIVGLSFVF
jgi:hypothetical protein